MNDFYTEQLVKRKSKAGWKLTLVALTAVLFLIAYFVVAYAIIPATIMIVVDVVVFKRTNIEYEYLYVNGDLDIDKIYAKESRKNMFEANMNDLEVLAPVGHPELKRYENLKGKKFISEFKDRKVYEMIINEKGNHYKVIFEPNEKIIEGIQRIAPRKVFD